MRSVAIPALAALLAACSGSPSEPAAPGHVRFAALATSYRAGDTVRAELRNTGETGVGYNFCDSRLERMEAFGWALAGSDSGPRPCLDILYNLKPGETAPTFRVLPAGTEPGTYRLRMEVSVDRARGNVVRTEPFTVRR
jgi:hypothetical protein